MKSMQKKAIVISSIVFVVLGTLYATGLYLTSALAAQEANNESPKMIHDSNPKSSATVEEVSRLVNVERQKLGVASLTLDPRMNAAAQAKADDMRNEGYYDHVNPKTGKHGYSLVYEYTGTLCRHASENLTGAISSQEAVDKWLVSKPHHDAMLNPNNSLVGYGINGNYVVQEFCQTK
jgi:uncharacterized protein YkwD